MKTFLLASLLLVAPALADGNGCDILPFTSGGGVITGIVSIYPDGSASVQGQCQGVPFASPPWIKAQPGADGSYYFDLLLVEGDLILKQRYWIPLQMHFTGNKTDAMDGDPDDDPAGEITVQSQTGMGKGSIQLRD